jgi:GAF domain-containing protein
MQEMELASLMATVASELRVEPSEELTVRSIVTRAVDVVADADSASLTVRRRRKTFETLSATDDMALRADQMQYTMREGPCVEALEKSEWYRSGEVRTDPRWPVWGPAVGEIGVGSLLSIDLLSGTQSIGALNMYSRQNGRFASPDEVDLALLYAVHAAHALESARLVTGLEVAVSSRHSIGIAQGILIERYGLTIEQSFNFLRRVSSHTNTKLAEVARQIVETGVIPPRGNGDHPRSAPEAGG